MEAICCEDNSTPEKMNSVPASTPVIAPIGLNACEKFNLLAALSGSPICAIKGLAAVSRNDRPLAITNSASKKHQYWPTRAAGQKRNVPVPNRQRPAIIPDLYPKRRIIKAAGVAN